jgi:hypothetical protein
VRAAELNRLRAALASLEKEVTLMTLHHIIITLHYITLHYKTLHDVT